MNEPEDKMKTFKYEHKSTGGSSKMTFLCVTGGDGCDKNVYLLTPAGTNNDSNDRRCLFWKIIV